MKKRVKLLTTIASLCLAVALMAFGVYAASTETFKTTSTVTFEAATDVFGKFTGSVTKTTSAGAGTPEKVSAEKKTTDNDWTVVGNNLMGSGAELGTSLSLDKIGDKYTFTYEFENYSPYKVEIDGTLTVKNGETEVTSNILTKDTQDDANAAAIKVTINEESKTELAAASGTTYQKGIWSVEIELASWDFDVETLTVDFSLTVTNPAA